jgi:hypothetical protein
MAFFRGERSYLNKELAEHAKAQDAVFENDTEQYYRHQARAERFAERADQKHQKHMDKEVKYLRRESLEVRKAEEAMQRGDAAGFAHFQYKAARYHNKAGNIHARKHYPATEGHSHHVNPNYRGEMPTASCVHEELPAYAFGGVPPLGRVPFNSGTVPAMPMAAMAIGAPTALTSMSTTVTSVPTMAAPLGSMGGYEEYTETGPTPYYTAPVVAEELAMGEPTIAGEFRRVTQPLHFVPLNNKYW